MATRKTASKQSIKKILIVYRTDSADALKMAEDVALWMKNQKLSVYSHPKQKINKVSKWPASKPLTTVDLVLVLGGDGTYLEAVRLLEGKKVPILGINLGSLGFLTETRKEDLYTALQMTLDKKMEMRPRSMLEVRVKRNGKTIYKKTALNDVVIERGSLSHLINLNIYSEHSLVCPLKADGIIISSPTGSTAYNLAAGGPILHPDVNAIVVSPICPHALTSRPMIFPDQQTLSFQLNDKNRKAYLVVDGNGRTEVKATDEIIIKKSAHFHFVLRKPSHNYFDLLREKLKFGERA